MTDVILVVVSDGFGGYGDFLFGLKLADKIRRYYANTLGEANAPQVKLITEDTGQKKIKTLKGDQEFGIEILTPTELKNKVDKKELNVTSMLEGPVFNSKLIKEVDQALSNQSIPPSLVLLTEYGCSSDVYRKRVKHQIEFRQRYLNNILYLEEIYTGLNKNEDEKGLILSDNLTHPADPSILSSQLDDKIHNVLLGEKSIETYRTNTDLYFQYSHDIYITNASITAARRFLEMHRIYSKNSDRNQDVLMIGRSMLAKVSALAQVADQLERDGYKKISFYDLDRGKETYYVGDANTAGKHYRVLYTSSMSHVSMMASVALSGDLVGATGDQSLAEAISADKLVVYECLSHKVLLSDEYYRQLMAFDDSTREMFELLKNADNERDFRRMEQGFSDEVKVKMKAACKNLRESVEVSTVVMEVVTPGSVLSNKITKGEILPYSDNEAVMSPFERTLRYGCFSAVSYVLKHHTNTVDERLQFCKIFSKRNNQSSFLSLLRSAEPNTSTTSEASYLVTRFNIEQYKPPQGSVRETMFNAYQDLVATFHSLGNGQHDEEALIGLLLLITKNISNEYYFLSPRKGLLFGSRFYTTVEDTLKELGVDLKTITPDKRKEYYLALSRVMQNNPNLLANEYLLESLSREAKITLPQIPELISDRKVKEIFMSKKPDESDPTIFRTTKGFIKMHDVPFGRGGWGSVYAARQYSLSGSVVQRSALLAIKTMSEKHQHAMVKEASMIKKAYPAFAFQQFKCEKMDTCYLAMPLFSGVPLDRYLSDNLSLSQTTREEIATALLECLDSIHVHGVIHHDIKPQNMLYDPVNKKMHIIDFGCAEEVGAKIQFQDMNTAKFAVEYMPPEYLRGDCATNKTDVYALALTLAEIFGANKRQLVKNRMERALKVIGEPINTSIQTAFNATGSLDKAMFTNEVQRYWQQDDFKKFLTSFVNETYDFGAETERLGEKVVGLLNRMQQEAPDKRPEISEALDVIKALSTEKVLGNK